MVLQAARKMNDSTQVRMNWSRIQKETGLSESIVKQALSELHASGILRFDGNVFWFE